MKRTTQSICITIVDPTGGQHVVSGRFAATSAHELVERVIGEFLPEGSLPGRLLRGGMIVAAFNPWRPLGVYHLRDGDVLETMIDTGQPITTPCFLSAYRVTKNALEQYEGCATAMAPLFGCLPPSGNPTE